jgi:hypothetical protein
MDGHQASLSTGPGEKDDGSALTRVIVYFKPRLYTTTNHQN